MSTDEDALKAAATAFVGDRPLWSLTAGDIERLRAMVVAVTPSIRTQTIEDAIAVLEGMRRPDINTPGIRGFGTEAQEDAARQARGFDAAMDQFKRRLKVMIPEAGPVW
jgi:hypothetical protein